jgi:PIN domain
VWGKLERASKIQRTMEEMGFGYLPVDAGAVMPFSRFRAKNKLKVADSIHIASAASAGIDLFLTGGQAVDGFDGGSRGEDVYDEAET